MAVAHGVGDGVGVQHHPPVDVARRPPHGLDQGRRRAQEARLVGVEDGHQLDLGEVEALAEEVDPDQHVVLPQPQVAQELDAGDGVHVGVEVPDPHTQLDQVVGQVLGHLLGQGGDERPGRRARPRSRRSAPGGRRSGPVVGWITTSGSTRPVGRMTCSTTWLDTLDLVGARGGRQEDDLADPLDELVEGEGPVVEGRGQPEAVLDQRLLARPVALVLPVDLGHRHVALVDHGQEVLGEEVEQGVRAAPPALRPSRWRL